MRPETTPGMEAQDKQESARVSMYRICSPVKPVRFKALCQREGIHAYIAVCVRARIHTHTYLHKRIHFYPTSRSFVHPFCGSQRGAKWEGRIDSGCNTSKQKHFLRAPLNGDVDVTLCTLPCSAE